MLDIDECSKYVSPCDDNAECYNNIGSYACVCKDGFTGNGTICLGKKHVSLFSSCFCFACLFGFCYLLFKVNIFICCLVNAPNVYKDMHSRSNLSADSHRRYLSSMASI